MPACQEGPRSRWCSAALSLAYRFSIKGSDGSGLSTGFIDWLQKNQPAVWGVLVNPASSLALGCLSLGLLAWGIWEVLQPDKRSATLDDLTAGASNSNNQQTAIVHGDHNMAVGGTGNVVNSTVLPQGGLITWPRIVLGYDKAAPHGFFVTNHSPNIEARAIQLHGAASKHYRLSSSVIPLAPASAKLPLELHCDLIESDETENWIKSASGKEAWETVAKDVWSDRLPDQSGLSDLDKFIAVGEAMAKDHNDAACLGIPIRIFYQDLAGEDEDYVSPSVVMWHVLAGVLEIRPGVISRKTRL
jgi:hypothetical protein